ncbi:hypothetical protein MVEN_00208100 [Mycena venus]|uniref:DUF4402 domain-containing protein n=1 Tax=Mycena venus TaxID=2733690 RepID=A0A8H7DAZ4_9AGAR|nr:hypothetical protein MVEN_00208100 [Mycena venus]
MKLLNCLALSVMLTTAFAQRAAIGAPADGSTVQRGSNITVEIDRPDTLTGSTEVALRLRRPWGTILYDGPFDPEFHTGVSKPPHQNFTVQIPSSSQTGKAQLGVAHFSLVGASQFPFLETFNITLNVV